MKRRRKSPVDAALSTEDVASCTECTGLIPALPDRAEGDKTRAALYGIHAPESPDGADGE